MEGKPLKHFVCPKDKNHSFEDKTALLKHLGSCKLLKGYKSFYSCKYQAYHLFTTPKLKEEHEEICPSKSMKTITKDQVLLSNFEFANPGYDPKFVPKKVDSQYYHKNKDRLDNEQEEIKKQKALLRINVADIVEKTESIKMKAEGVVRFIARISEHVISFQLKVLKGELVKEIDLDLSPEYIFSIQPADSKICETLKTKRDLLSCCLGELNIWENTVWSKKIGDDFVNSVVKEGRLFLLKDKKENVSVICSCSHVYQGGLPFIPDNAVKVNSLLVVFLEKSNFFKEVLDRSNLEKGLHENIAYRLAEQMRIIETVKSQGEIYSNESRKLRYMQQYHDSVKEELGICQQSYLQFMDSDDQGTSKMSEMQAEIEMLNFSLTQKRAEMEQDTIRCLNEKVGTYMEMYGGEVTAQREKMGKYEAKISAMNDNLKKAETFNRDLEELKEQEAEASVSLAEDKELISAQSKEATLFRPSDLQEVTKRGIVCALPCLCLCCKESYVSMMTQPCNHCVLCWKCYYAYISVGHRACPVCDKRINYCLKLIFS
jgi:hypothetical protein